MVVASSLGNVNLLVYFIVFMHLNLVVLVYSVSIVIFVDVMEILFYLLINYFIGEVIIA